MIDSSRQSNRTEYKSLSENCRGLSRFCAVRRATWDCPLLRGGFRIGSKSSGASRPVFWLLPWLALAVTASGGSVARAAEPVRVIFDTDLSSDVDDVGAVAVLHALADAGEAEILGMGICVNDAASAPCLNALNTFYGRPDIPIGVLPGTGKDSPSKYTRGVADEFPHRLASAADAPQAVGLYRQLLAHAARSIGRLRVDRAR